MRFTIIPAVLLALSLTASGVLAHEDHADIDTFMGSEEQFFQAIDEPAPPFDLVDAEGSPVSLSDFADKIVVLNFIFASCTDVCPLQSEVIADIQDKINVSPMKDMVQFITITTDPETDTPDVLRSYGEVHGLDPANWIFLTARPTDPEDTTRELSEAYDNTFTPLEDGQQMHGVVTNVIDRGGRLAAKFHGLRFEPVNMVLYINGLINEPHEAAEAPDEGWWGRLTGLLQ